MRLQEDLERFTQETWRFSANCYCSGWRGWAPSAFAKSLQISVLINQFLNGLDYRQIHWLWSYSLQCKYDCISVIWVSNSDFSKTPITPHESCHVLVMSREHNGSIFDAALVAKWLHIWNVLKWRPRGRTVIISQGVSGTSTLAFICIGLASETDVIQSLLKVNNDPCYVYQGHVSGSIGLG